MFLIVVAIFANYFQSYKIFHIKLLTLKYTNCTKPLKVSLSKLCDILFFKTVVLIQFSILSRDSENLHLLLHQFRLAVFEILRIDFFS